MGADYYRRTFRAEGQLHSNACWAASISWWLKVMAYEGRRTYIDQINMLADFNQFAVLGGGVSPKGIKEVCKSARIRIDMNFVAPSVLKESDIQSPCLVIFNYPTAGGTHMNVIMEKKGDTVMCMEPFFPLQANEMGERKGTYIRRPVSFFANSQEIGFGTLPLSDYKYGTEENRG